jgi:CMP-N,N'-diacetyllegionaminic acid synthase
MTNIIIIPARSGSKRLKNKNLLKLNNLTLVEKTIKFAKKIKNIDKIIVSSNNLKVLNYKKKYKNILFIKRPKTLATSKSLLIDTVFYLNNFFDKSFNNIIILQPTSPYRSIKFINNLWLNFISLTRTCKSTVSVSKETLSNKRKFVLKKGYLFSKKKNKKESFYEANGNFFMVNMNFLMKFKCFVKSSFSRGSIILLNKHIIDIDTKDDYKLAKRYA